MNQIIPQEYLELYGDSYAFISKIHSRADNDIWIVESLQSEEKAIFKRLSRVDLPYWEVSRVKNNIHIPKVYSIKETDICTYVIEEYIDGYTLEELIKQGYEFTVPEIVDIAVQICDALEPLHARDIVHRDIKPTNVMLTKDNVVKLIDFDAARMYDPNQKQDTIYMATPGFGAPEVEWGQTDQRSDIYSLGCTMKVLLPMGLFFIPEIREILDCCTVHNPANRYNSISILKNILIDVQGLLEQKKRDVKLGKIIRNYLVNREVENKKQKKLKLIKGCAEQGQVDFQKELAEYYKSDDYINDFIFELIVGEFEVHQLQISRDNIYQNGRFNPVVKEIYCYVREYICGLDLSYSSFYKANEWYEKALKNGDVDAQVEIGRLYFEYSNDGAAGFELVRNAKNKGSVFAAGVLGDFYYYSRDMDAAFQEYKYAAENGNVMAQASYGALLIDGIGGTPNKDEGMRLILEAANTVNVDPVWKALGEYVIVIDEDYEQALKYFKNIKDETTIADHIGDCYEELGQYQKAFEYYSNIKASDRSADTSCNLGDIYYYEFKDKTKAFEHYRRAARKGSERGAFMVGTYYENGYGGRKKNIYLAEKFYRDAINLGSTQARYNLAMLYLTENEFKDNEYEATDLLKSAADDEVFPDSASCEELAMYYLVKARQLRAAAEENDTMPSKYPKLLEAIEEYI